MKFTAAVCLVLGLSLSANAASWTETFTPDRIATHLTGQQMRVIVVAAGTDPAQSRPAATALIEALRQCGKTKIVMGDDGLGSVANLDDRVILEKTWPLVVHLTFIVRMTGDTPDAQSAVVVAFNRAGKVATAFTAGPGTPIDARPDTGLGQGVSDNTVASVVRNTPDRPNAQEEYEKQRVYIRTIEGYEVAPNMELRQRTRAFKGKYGETLDGPAFYEFVGRSDLADAYRSRRRSALAISLSVGGALVAGGVVLLVYGSASDTFGYTMAGSCILGASAPVLMMSVLLFNPHPVDGPTRYRLADEYNARLRRQLGLSARVQPGQGTQRRVATRVAPWLSSDGGGLSFGMTF